MLPVLILAGGLATRLRPITETIPKALIEIAGEPFIYHQLRYLRSQGVTRVILSVGYLGEMIESLVGSEKKFNLEIFIVHDGTTLLGTGGAVKKALPLLGESFFVQYGDSFLPVDFSMVQTAFMKSGKPALMTVLKNNNQWDKSNVILENNQLLEYNKKIQKPQMNYIDYGLGVLTKEVFKRYPVDEPFDLATVYNELSSKNMLAGFEVYERFYEIGSLSGIKETSAFITKFMSKEMP
jgi:NDP-sugar pyrophosphorylase family protein